ncbi:MAG TPA: hypothetical protein PLN33_15110 [Hyphomonadaceae bacterium]|nr:hypothetical protein [Hyphomonadaceae bacterium]
MGNEPGDRPGRHPQAIAKLCELSGYGTLIREGIFSMLRATLLAAISLAAAVPGWAQSCYPSTPERPTTVEYVEARRPMVDGAKLTGDQKSAAKKLVSTIMSKVRDKDYSPRLADIEELRPYGASGDREIMKTLVEAYMDAGEIAVADGQFSGEPARMLAGLWAMQLYMAGDRSREMARALSSCLGTVETWYSPMGSKGTCGFDVEVNENDYDKSIKSFAEGKGRLPKVVTFKEKTLLVPLEDEKARFEKALVAYRGANSNNRDDNWAVCWAKRHPEGDYFARWDGSAAVAQKAYRDEEESKVLRAKWKIEDDIKAWNTLNALRLQAEKPDSFVPLWDKKKFIDLSYELGGKYLEPLATKIYLGERGVISSFCTAVPGEICQRQRRILEREEAEYAAKNAEARLEYEMRDARWRAAVQDNAPGSSSSVRTYDQNSNYQGSETMPKWQADILAGH